jgi:hypothetical protein
MMRYLKPFYTTKEEVFDLEQSKWSLNVSSAKRSFSQSTLEKKPFVIVAKQKEFSLGDIFEAQLIPNLVREKELKSRIRNLKIILKRRLNGNERTTRTDKVVYFKASS